MTWFVDFSLGPVQAFVERSRRTRDLWASSYLLSYLAGHAMAAVRKQSDTDVVRPIVAEDPLLAWIEDPANHNPPTVGSLPNHFVFRTDGDPREVAEKAASAVREAWGRVCEAVWRRFLDKHQDAGRATRQIWERQTRDYWEILWVASRDEREVSRLLATRKHFRTHWPPDEPGDKCTLLHEFQELSGHERARGREHAAQQKAFWHALREDIGTLELREDERLCAVSFVKRFYPLVAEAGLGASLEHALRWPSTVHIAALPWIAKVLQHAPEHAERFATRLRSAAPGAFSEVPIGLDRGAAGRFARIDGNYLHKPALADPDRTLLIASAEDRATRDELVRLLERIAGETDDKGRRLGSPSTFYAILLADGDHVGDAVKTLGPDIVSSALARFTRGAPDLVSDHQGRTVYAGGDDLLALLPVPRALECADRLARLYREVFGEIPAPPTLSAAVVFAPARFPLASALDESHHVLDEIAKEEQNGRDSIAVSVLKGGGRHCLWASKWQLEPTTRAVEQLSKLVSRLTGEVGAPRLSASLLHRLHRTLDVACGHPRWTPGSCRRPAFDLVPLVQAEVASSLSQLEAGEGEAAALAHQIVQILRVARAEDESASAISLDPLLLARFLATEGRPEGSP